jgi:hypothetical protein
MAYTQELIKAGVLKGGSELKPVSTATTVRVRGGKVLTTDGPFAETKEQLGGYYLVDVPTSTMRCAGRQVPGRQARHLRGAPAQSRALSRCSRASSTSWRGARVRGSSRA